MTDWLDVEMNDFIGLGKDSYDLEPIKEKPREGFVSLKCACASLIDIGIFRAEKFTQDSCECYDVGPHLRESKLPCIIPF